MSALPDDLWRRILKIGTSTPNLLNFKDLCCLSITCRSLNRLSIEDHLWFDLLTSDFPQISSSVRSSVSSSSNNNVTSQNPTSKVLYRIRYERNKSQKLAAHRRVVLRIESQIAEHIRKLDDLKVKSAEEREKIQAAVTELSNLRRIRQASVALNVWQPEIVRGKQKQLVEQCVVPMESRIHAIEMEIRLCKQQLECFDKTCKDVRRRLNDVRLELESAKYHPLAMGNQNVTTRSKSVIDKCCSSKKRRNLLQYEYKHFTFNTNKKPRIHVNVNSYRQETTQDSKHDFHQNIGVSEKRELDRAHSHFASSSSTVTPEN